MTELADDNLRCRSEPVSRTRVREEESETRSVLLTSACAVSDHGGSCEGKAGKTFTPTFFSELFSAQRAQPCGYVR